MLPLMSSEEINFWCTSSSWYSQQVICSMKLFLGVWHEKVGELTCESNRWPPKISVM